MKNFKSLCFSTVLILCAYCTPIFAESVYNANVRVELVSDAVTIIPGEDFWIGLKMTMDDGWHTYWRNSGDSGMATRIEWQLPDGFEAGKLHWPYPKRIDYMGGLTSYVLGGKAVLLTKIKTPANLNAGHEQQMSTKVSWLSCEKICVPGRAELSITLVVGSGQAQKEESVHKLFVQEKKHWPILENSWQVTAVDQGNTFLFNIDFHDSRPHNITELAFFPYRNDVIDHAAKQTLKSNTNGYELVTHKSALLDEDIQKIEGVLVSREGWQNNGEEQGLLIDIPVHR